jgi:hypothetical protein
MLVSLATETIVEGAAGVEFDNRQMINAAFINRWDHFRADRFIEA